MQRIIALLLFPSLIPFICLIYILFKLTASGTFIFRQKRMGKDLHPFIIYKIRTMIEKAETEKVKIQHLNEAKGPVFKIKNDPRLTPIGRILSNSGWDEILQLLNIIKGEMSFVGPRPLPVYEANKIPQKYRERFKILPGITSTWIVNGAHRLSFDEWMRLDIAYVDQKNVILDIVIILKTLILSFSWLVKSFF